MVLLHCHDMRTSRPDGGTALANATIKPDFYARYIDDSIGIWTGSHQELVDFLTYLNSLHQSIKFTMEDTHSSGSIPYLDTLIKLENSGAYSTELYIKPNHSGIIIHYTSSQPMSTKKAVIRGEFRRAIRLSSSQTARSNSIKKIQDMFEKNGYPKKLIKRLLHEVMQDQQLHHRDDQRHGQRQHQQQQRHERTRQHDPDSYLVSGAPLHR